MLYVPRCVRGIFYVKGRGCAVGGNTLDMTKGSAWKLIVQFAVPVFLSQVFQQLYNTADALIVGLLFGWTVSM